SYERIEDVAWTCSFVWSQVGDRPVPLIVAPEDPTDRLDAALAELQADVSRRPLSILPLVSNPVTAYMDVLMTEVVGLIKRVAAIVNTPEVLIEDFQGIAASTEAVLLRCNGIRQTLGDENVEDLVATDDVYDRLAVETWRGATGGSLQELMAEAVEARESVRQRVASDYLDVVVIKDNQTLRDLAREYYGSADDWTVIADANGLTNSDPPVGTVVFIPRRPGGG
ncbi:unnamed protein product, partial [marine sediment metagenome]